MVTAILTARLSFGPSIAPIHYRYITRIRTRLAARCHLRAQLAATIAYETYYGALVDSTHAVSEIVTF